MIFSCGVIYNKENLLIISCPTIVVILIHPDNEILYNYQHDLEKPSNNIIKCL